MKYKIGELAEIIDGDRSENYPQFRELMNSGYCLFLDAKNVTADGFEFETLQYITEFKDFILNKGRLVRGDIVYTTRGTVGNAAYYSNNIPYDKVRINSGMIIIRCKEDIVRGEFLFQILKSKYYRPLFLKISSGSAQPQLPIKNFVNIKLDIPPLDIQKRIIDILSNYDSLIENNRKQIKLLEEVAQRLYKRWVTDLRMPGLKKGLDIESVPKNWKRIKISKILANHFNGGWGKNVKKEGCIFEGDVIRGTDINDIKNGEYTKIPHRYHTEQDIKNKKLEPNDLILELSNGAIDNIGRCLFVDTQLLKRLNNAISASFCKVLRAYNSDMAILLYLEIQKMQSDDTLSLYKKQGTNGINNFDFSEFLEHTVIIPNSEFMETFRLIMKEITCVREELSLLVEARDSLLPKLMSGKLEV